jgi:peptide/nickel transport system permease protein
VAAFRAEIGLDRPAHIRYLQWLKGMLTGDMGRSLASKREITEFIGTRLSNTLFLGGVAAAFAVPLALLLGLLAALYRNSLYDRIVNLTTLTSISFPEFFVAYILILFLSVKSGIFPGISNVSTDLAFGDKLFRTLLPALTLTLVVLAHMLRMTRAAIINL